MRTHTVGAALLLGALTLAGCQDEGPLGTNDPGPSFAKEMKQLPLHGWSQGSETWGPLCGGPTLVVLTVTGTGEMSHMGAIGVKISGCVDLTTFETVGPAPGVLTAANGDRAYMEMLSLVLDPMTGQTLADYEFVGGTGRFKDITGEFSSVGIQVKDTPGVTWRNTVKGWINY